MTQPAKSTSEVSPLKRALHALDKMQSRLDVLEREKREPLAVIGMSCRFPGGVDSPDSFWRLLVEGRDGVTAVPAERPGADAWERICSDAKTCELIRQGGFVEAVDQFDAGFFGISPREADCMDPQQRILLQVSCEALEAAGQPLEKLAGSTSGVFVGIHNHSSDYYLLQAVRPEEMDTYASTGTAHSIVANRLSYVLDMQGPSVAVDTACSSSLIALHLACRSLRDRECDLALAGGVNLILSPEASFAFSKLGFLSPDCRCKTFDANADGFVRAEGCGVVVIKRLADAMRDADPILAVIRGTAVNQDGATNGLTAPNGLSQERVIRSALENAGVDPAEITFVETHGTGTPLGDPIEVDALRAVIGSKTRCALGSVKTQIGHTEASAGIAGVIKTILALRHQTIPPNLHFRALNPHISLADSGFFIPVKPTAWEGIEGRRFAGVSSFGFGGTNGHVILEEAPTTRTNDEGAGAPTGAQSVLLPISARSEGALDQLVSHWREFLSVEQAQQSLRDIVYTASVRHTQHPHRLAILGSGIEELRAKLAELEQGRIPAGVARGCVGSVSPQLAFVFSGQGPQWWAMGRELIESEPIFQREIERCAEEMKRYISWDLLEELARDEATSRVGETEIAQPALFALQIGLAALWKSWGIEPQALVGHSVGEVAAAHVGGVLSFEDAVRVICHRARLMQGATGLGKMAAVELPEFETKELLRPYENRISIAAVNSPASTVVSGETEAVEAVVALATERGVRTKVLPVNYAFHSPQMERFRDEMTSAVSGVNPQSPPIPVYSTVKGALADGMDFDAVYWGNNIRQTVRFADAIRVMLDGGCDTFIELSPQPVLASMIARCAEAAGKKTVVFPSLRQGRSERAHMLESLAGLFTVGSVVNWRQVHRYAGQVVPLPPYPWQQKRFWLEEPKTPIHPASTVTEAESRKCHGRRLHSPGLRGAVFETRLGARSPRFLKDHQIFGALIVPAPLLVEIALGGAREALASEDIVVTDFLVLRAMVLDAQNQRVVQLLLDSPDAEASDFQIHSADLTEGQEPTWTLHATGKVRLRAKNTVVAESPFDAAAIGDSFSQTLSADQFYRRFEIRGAVFGPTFRAVDNCRQAIGRALTELRLPESLETEAENYCVHPVLLDAALQSIAVGRADPAEKANAAEGLFVFCGFEEFNVSVPGQSRLVCHATLVADNDGASEAFCGHAYLYTESGVLAAEIKGARFKHASREALLSSHAVRPEDLTFEVIWCPRSCPAHNLRRAAPDFLPGMAPLREELQRGLNVARADEREGAGREVIAAFDRLSILYVLRALDELGWRSVSGRRFTDGELVQALKIADKHSRLVSRMLEMLSEEGIVRRTDGVWEIVSSQPDKTEIPTRQQLLARFPDYQEELALFDRCASRLKDVLRGTCDPLQLLFPEGSVESASRIYQDAPLSRLPNALMRHVCQSVLRSMPSGRVLRVLEIGAGTGGTTAHLLPLLRDVPCEYVFTDLSKLFFQAARTKFAEFPFVRYTMLDAEKPPEAQGFGLHQFDLVVAANVLHATRDLRQTLTHARSLLAPGGMLALIEGIRPARWIDLVFGQTEGWWRFSDSDLRASHPLLSLEKWEQVLVETGFESCIGVPAMKADRTSVFEQAVIVAKTRADQPVAAEGSSTERVREILLPDRQRSQWLILGDESALCEQVVRVLETRGDEVVRFVKGTAFAELGRCKFQMDPSQADQLDQAIKLACAATKYPCRYVLCLWGADSSPEFIDAESLYERAISLSAEVLTAAQALIRNGQSQRPRLWVGTRGVQPVGGTKLPELSASPLWGLGRVLAVEHPEIWGGLIDLDPDALPEENARALVAQASFSEGEDQSVYRAGTRFVPRLVGQRQAAERSLTWAENGCYVVTGGLGGVALHIARWLALQGARKIVLMGRTPLPSRSEWDGLDPHSRSYEQVASIREIEKAGATVRSFALDVADRNALGQTIVLLREEGWLPVCGVVHAAAAIEDRLVPQLDKHGLNTAFRPKILGALNLDQCLSDQPLQFFVSCSSLGAFLGQAGQANYAAANAFLDAFVHYRHARQEPILGVDWGGWYGAGFAITPGGRRTIKSLEQRGILGFTPDDGVAALGLLLRRRVTQASVMRMDWDRFRQTYPAGEEPPFLAELAAGHSESRVFEAGPSKPVEPKTGLREQLLALESGAARRVMMEDHLKMLLGAILKIEPTVIEVEKPMGSIGLDSLMGFELKNRCEQTLGLTLSATIVWNYPTIAALAGYLAEKLGVSLEDNVTPGSANEPEGESAVSESSTAEVVTGVEALSEEAALRALLCEGGKKHE